MIAKALRPQSEQCPVSYCRRIPLPGHRECEAHEIGDEMSKQPTLSKTLYTCADLQGSESQASPKELRDLGAIAELYEKRVEESAKSLLKIQQLLYQIDDLLLVSGEKVAQLEGALLAARTLPPEVPN